MDPNHLQKNSQNCSWQRHIIINNMVSFKRRDFKERNEEIRSKQNFELENQRGLDQDHWQFSSQQHDVGIKSLKIEKTHKIGIV